MKCLRLSKLIEYQAPGLSENEHREIKEHLQSCALCQRKLTAYADLKQVMWQHAPVRSGTRLGECYDPLELATYLEGQATGRARRQFHRHLAHCSLCLDNLVAMKRLLSELQAEGFIPVSTSEESVKDVIARAGQSALDKLRDLAALLGSPKPAYRWAGLAAVAVIAFFLIILPEKTGKTPFATRDSMEISTAAQIELLAPVRRSVVSAELPEFRWSGPAEITAYNFMLLDINSEVVWEEETEDTHITLPAEVMLLPDLTYFWQVEGKFESGNTLLSVMASFTYQGE